MESWVKCHSNLRDHPKLWRLMDELDTSKAETRGLLIGLWWWAMSYAPDGDLSEFTSGEIARACDWTGNADVLITSLVQTGWLDEEPEGLTIHDWQDHGGKLHQQKERNRERVAKYRQDAPETVQESDTDTPPADTDSTKTLRNAYVTRTSRVCNALDKNRIDKSTCTVQREAQPDSSDSEAEAPSEPYSDPFSEDEEELSEDPRQASRQLTAHYINRLRAHYNLTPQQIQQRRGMAAGAVRTCLTTYGLPPTETRNLIDSYFTTRDPAWTPSLKNGKPGDGFLAYARDKKKGRVKN